MHLIIAMPSFGDIIYSHSSLFIKFLGSLKYPWSSALPRSQHLMQLCRICSVRILQDSWIMRLTKILFADILSHQEILSNILHESRYFWECYFCRINMTYPQENANGFALLIAGNFDWDFPSNRNRNFSIFLETVVRSEGFVEFLIHGTLAFL